MGQAKQRGSYEQRRQAAIAKTMPNASATTLNEAYKQEKRRVHRMNPRATALMLSAMCLGWPSR